MTKYNNRKTKWLEKKIRLVEKEIYNWESKHLAAEVNLRENKKKLWNLMEELEQVELKEGE